MIKEKPYALFILEPKVLDRLMSIFENKERIINDILPSTQESYMNSGLFYDLVLNLKGCYSMDDAVEIQSCDGDSVEEYARIHQSIIDFMEDSFSDLQTFFPAMYKTINNLVVGAFEEVNAVL